MTLKLSFCLINYSKKILFKIEDKTFLKNGDHNEIFKKHYLKSKQNMMDLYEPDVTLGYILGLMSCKIQSIFTF